MPDYIIVNDGLENWMLYPDDKAYAVAIEIAPDEKGIRHIDPKLTEAIDTWWWRQAIERVDKLIEKLAIPWEELVITELELTDSSMMGLSEKLAHASFYIVQVNNRLTHLLALQSAGKEALEHAVNKMLAHGDDSEGRKPAADIRRAAAISRDKRLRNLKIELIEAGAQIKALETTKDSLDTLWRTASRVLSCRLREPID